MATTTQSAQFSLEEKLAALQTALDTGAITKAQYTAQYNTLTNPSEPFSWSKFLEGMVSVLNPVGWAKDIAGLFNIRMIIIYCVVGYAIFHWGLNDRIPTFDLGPNSLNGKAYSIDLGNGSNLVLNKSGQLQVTDRKTGKVQKTIRVKDIPALNVAIHPVGFQLKPIGVVGMGAGASGLGVEAGAGVSVFKAYNWETDVFATNRGAYLGESYRLDKFAGGNTSIGLAGGMGWKGDLRVLAYMRWAF